MKRWLGYLSLFAVLLVSTPSFAANTSVPNMTAATAVAGTDLWYCVQSAGTTDRKCTSAQVAAYIYGLMSGDATTSGTGAITFATVNSNVGSFGSATNCTSVTVNAKGLVTAASQTTCTPAVGSITGLGTGVGTALGTNVGTAGAFVVNGGALGTPSSGVATNLTGTAAGLTAGTVTTNANLTGAVTSTGNATLLGSFSSANLLAALTTKTGTGNAVFGSAPTIDSLNATTAATLAFITGSTQCLQVNSSGAISGTGSACGAGGGGTITAGTTPTSGFTSGHFVQSNGSVVQDATAVTSVGAGCGTSTGGSNITTSGNVTAALGARINTSTSDPIVAGDCGNVVYENSASSVAASLAQAGTTGFGANTFFVVCNINAGVVTITPATSTIGGASTLVVNAGTAANPNCAGFRSDGTNYTIDDTVMGAGVAAALGASVSTAGGFPVLIGAGTAALGTTLIASGACGSATTVSASGVATTDTIQVGFNGDPTATTGYLPTAMLTIVPYPTANNVNFKQCNLTGAGITPSALTVNWRVER